MYLALTGQHLKGGVDLVASGVATHWLPSERIAEAEAALCDLPVGGDVGGVLDGMAEPVDSSEFSLAPQVAACQERGGCFVLISPSLIFFFFFLVAIDDVIAGRDD